MGQVISQPLEMYFQRGSGHWVWLASFGEERSFLSRRTPGNSASTFKKQVTVQPYPWAFLIGFGLSHTESWHFPNLTLFEEVSNACNVLLQSQARPGSYLKPFYLSTGWDTTLTF